MKDFMLNKNQSTNPYVQTNHNSIIRKNIKLLFLFPLLFLFFLSYSCKSPTAPGTTSNNYSWQKFTFGGAASSSLEDVAIIDANNIWAVGTIYLTDSTGNPEQAPHNAVHWDGNKWSLMKIMFPLCDSNGHQQGSGPYSAKGIFAFSPNDIWISCDVSLVHWNGQNFEPVCMPLGYGQRNLGKIWGGVIKYI